MTEQTRSRKRRKADQDAVELFDRVVDSCRRVIDLFDRPYELNIARDGLAKLSEFVSQLDAALQRSESADTVLLTTESKDQLDSLGTALWNKALGLKPLTKRDDTSASVLAAGERARAGSPSVRAERVADLARVPRRQRARLPFN